MPYDRNQPQRNSGHHGGDRNRNNDPEERFRSNYKFKLGDQYDEILKSEKADYNAYIDKVKDIVKAYKNDISTSQLRNIFFDVRQKKTPSELYVLRPKLAYAGARAEKKGAKVIMLLFDDLISQTKTEEEVVEFQNFFEAVIAYHKYFGGRN
jgi:CRISPR-associated protein Csm2